VLQSNLCLPDYPIGHLIADRLGEYTRKAGKIVPELQRVTWQGYI